MADTNDPERFWRDYEEKVGERVLKYALGRLASGAEELEGPLWGLVIATEGGFRFHHFPSDNWLSLVFRASKNRGTPEEKTLFVPKERIVSAAAKRKQSLLQRIFAPVPPTLELRYCRSDGGEGIMLVEVDGDLDGLVQALGALPAEN